MPAPIITPYTGDLPSTSRPGAPFAAAAADTLQFVTAFPAQLNNFAAYFNTLEAVRTPATYGGSANAFTLTTGASLTSAPVGMMFSFIPTATNTGAATVKIDGTTYPAKRMHDAGDLPSGYLRVGRLTHCWRVGSNVLIGRDPERITNANGAATRLPDGTQVCNITNLSLTFGSTARLSATWTFPAAFAAAPSVGPSLVGSLASYTGTDNDIGTTKTESISASSAFVSLFRIAGAPAFAAGTTAPFSAIAQGIWF